MQLRRRFRLNLLLFAIGFALHCEAENKVHMEFTAVVTHIQSCPQQTGLIDQSDNEFMCVLDKAHGAAITTLTSHLGEIVQIKGIIQTSPNERRRLVVVERLNGQKIRGSNPHSFGFSDALMLGAMGVQGAAAGMQTNAVLRQQQVAQMQAEQAAYQRQKQEQAAQQITAAQQADYQRRLQEQAAPTAITAQQGAASPNTTANGLSLNGHLPEGCLWPSDFDLIRDQQMLSVLRNENFARQLLAARIPTEQQIASGEQTFQQLKVSLSPLEETIRSISSPRISHFNFKFDYDATCVNSSSSRGALQAAECQYVNTQNAMYAMNGTLQILDCVARHTIRPSIGPPLDQQVAEDESLPPVAERQPTQSVPPAPASVTPPPEHTCSEAPCSVR